MDITLIEKILLKRSDVRNHIEELVEYFKFAHHSQEYLNRIFGGESQFKDIMPEFYGDEKIPKVDVSYGAINHNMDQSEFFGYRPTRISRGFMEDHYRW